MAFFYSSRVMSTATVLRVGRPENRGSIAGWSERFDSSPKHRGRLWDPHVLRLRFNIATATANQWVGIYRELLRRQTIKQKYITD